MPDFLLEIGTEEIPARMIDAASAELRERVGKLLERERLPATNAPTSVETPRRLAVIALGIPASQADLTEQVTGPALTVAYKDGQPTQAAQQFAKKHGLDVNQLGKTTTPKGEYLTAKAAATADPYVAKVMPVAAASCTPIACNEVSLRAASLAAILSISPATDLATAPESRAVLRPMRSLAWIPVVPS